MISASATLQEPQKSENCALILAPFGQDSALISRMLASADIEALRVSDMPAFTRKLPDCAVGLVTTEALSPETLPLLQAALQAQPPWSDIPLILLSGGIDAAS